MQSWTQDHSRQKLLRGSSANRYDTDVLSSLFVIEGKRGGKEQPEQGGNGGKK